jgi:hypothetical protein
VNWYDKLPSCICEGLNMKRAFPLVAAQSVTWWTFLVAACLHGSAAGCDTPVYRYAMYRWLPAPYELYYFYEGQPDAAGEKVQAAVEALTLNVKPAANLALFPVDLQKDQELTGIPPDVKDAWGKRAPQPTPWYLISSPVGMHMFGGTITESEIASLIDSPLRQEIGKSLELGQAGVYLLLTCDNAAANEAAEKEIRGVLDEVATGKIALYAAPQAAPEDDAPKSPAVEFGFLKVARHDAAEKWLVECLLALEPDLRASTEPVVFLVYGRGRALFSCLGKGIQRNNLIQDVEFISGACSCTVKEQNPGVDLLIRYDWDSVAEALAQKFGSEEGSPYRFGGDALFPELVIPMTEPSTTPQNETTAGAAESPPNSESVALATDSPPTLSPSPTNESPAPPELTATESDAQPEKAGVPPQVAANSPPTVTAPSAELKPPPVAGRAVLWVGAGLLGALILLFGATFLVLRPR